MRQLCKIVIIKTATMLQYMYGNYRLKNSGLGSKMEKYSFLKTFGKVLSL